MRSLLQLYLAASAVRRHQWRRRSLTVPWRWPCRRPTTLCHRFTTTRICPATLKWSASNRRRVTTANVHRRAARSARTARQHLQYNNNNNNLRLIRLRQTAQPYTEQSATQSRNNTMTQLSHRTAITTFSTEGCQKQTAPRCCQHPIRWALYTVVLTL